MKPLWEATRDLHHKAESHPVAKRMVDGSITAQEWADWLHGHWTIQQRLDPHIPLYVRRSDALASDLLDLLPLQANSSPAAEAFAATLVDPITIFGSAYLTIGAHRRGGRVIEKAMKDRGVNLPAAHIQFDQPQETELFIKKLREIPLIADGARRAFQVLFEIMDEIEERFQEKNREST
jgi:heme oxygenase